MERKNLSSNLEITNNLQAILAQRLYGDLAPEQAMEHWIGDGYAERFRDLLSKRPEFEDSLGSSVEIEEILEQIKNDKTVH